jgi:hypothetical protein
MLLKTIQTWLLLLAILLVLAVQTVFSQSAIAVAGKNLS